MLPPWHPKHFFDRLLDTQQDRDLLIGGEAPQVLLREDFAAVEGDLEDPTAGGHQLDLEVRVEVLQLSGQTDRLGVVVSRGAVFDAQLHGVAPGTGLRSAQLSAQRPDSITPDGNRPGSGCVVSLGNRRLLATHGFREPARR